MVLPALFAEETERFAFPAFEVDSDDASVLTVELGQLLGLDDGGHRVTLLRAYIDVS